MVSVNIPKKITLKKDEITSIITYKMAYVNITQFVFDVQKSKYP